MYYVLCVIYLCITRLNQLQRCPQEIQQRAADVRPSEDDPGETMEKEELPQDQECGATGSPPQVSPSLSVMIDAGNVWSGRFRQRPPKDTRGRSPYGPGCVTIFDMTLVGRSHGTYTLFRALKYK